MSLPTLSLTPARRATLARRIRFLVAATISYNLIEAAVALGAGARASSSALIGFGLDSLIEVASAAAVAWQFAGRDPETREKAALRIIAFSFFGLAAFVSVDAVRSLLGAGEARHSTVGLVLAAVSLAVMPLLSYAQRRAGRELGSTSAVADSKQTLLCTYLSAVLLVGLALNTLFGWSWAGGDSNPTACSTRPVTDPCPTRRHRQRRCFEGASADNLCLSLIREGGGRTRACMTCGVVGEMDLESVAKASAAPEKQVLK